MSGALGSDSSFKGLAIAQGERMNVFGMQTGSVPSIPINPQGEQSRT